MHYTKFVGWLCFSAITWVLPAGAQSPIQFQIQNGSSLSLPSGFDQILHPGIENGREVVIAIQTATGVQVIFVHTPEKIDFRPEKILNETLQGTIRLEAVSAPFAQGVHRNPIQKVLSPGIYANHYVAYDERYYHGGSAFFFLLGMGNSFFEYVTPFEKMVDQFKTSKPKFDMSMTAIPIWIILAAMGLLTINLWVIFSSFKEMAHIST